MEKFNWKSFISIGLFISFFVILFSGVILYLVPPGRVAYWIRWKILFLSKSEWENIHTVFSYFFAVLSVFHLFSVNWKAFLSYISSQKRKIKELTTAGVISVFLLVATLFEIPPVNYVLDFGSYLSKTWKTEQNAAPLYNAEKYSLNELTSLLPYLNKDTIIIRFKRNNIKFNGFEQSLNDIANENNKKPIELYELIK